MECFFRGEWHDVVVFYPEGFAESPLWTTDGANITLDAVAISDGLRNRLCDWALRLNDVEDDEEDAYFVLGRELMDEFVAEAPSRVEIEWGVLEIDLPGDPPRRRRGTSDLWTS